MDGASWRTGTAARFKLRLWMPLICPPDRRHSTRKQVVLLAFPLLFLDALAALASILPPRHSQLRYTTYVGREVPAAAMLVPMHSGRTVATVTGLNCRHMPHGDEEQHEELHPP